ncbi:MAG: ABC transporter permease [Candidatus Bipolaricaulia bacterium]
MASIAARLRWQNLKQGILGKLFGNQKFVIGFTIIAVIFIGGFIARNVLPFEYRRTGAFPSRRPPSLEHIMGTDSLGRRIDVQLADSIVNSLQIGLIAATIGTVVGALLGFTSGYYGGRLDAVLRVLIDVFLSVPSLLFLILIAALVRGVSVQVMALVIGAFAWAWPARQIRAQVLSLKERGFVDMAILSGMSRFEIVMRELMPHMFQWMGANFVNATLAAILAESGLSILGLGPQREMTLGMMIYWALQFNALFNQFWWWWSAPVLTLTLIFLSLYLMHLGFDEVINPRIRSKA